MSPQVIGWPDSGIRMSKTVVQIAGVGDPNLSATVDVVQAQMGSIYWRTDLPDTAHWLYACTQSAVIENGQVVSRSVWTAK